MDDWKQPSPALCVHLSSFENFERRAFQSEEERGYYHSQDKDHKRSQTFLDFHNDYSIIIVISFFINATIPIIAMIR